jgi:hypothetical protein
VDQKEVQTGKEIATAVKRETASNKTQTFQDILKHMD